LAGAEALMAEAPADDSLINDLLGGTAEQDTLVDELLEDILAEQAQEDSAEEVEDAEAVADNQSAEEVGQEVLEDTALAAVDIAGDLAFVLEPTSLDDLLSQQNMSVM